ncbi:MAG: hypothetical protein NTV62_00195 [Candidatus Gribaldobacteria bacterium]|nr:hypothetical protein [Candidatus Gribaldobacteria bacterium]
MSKRETTIDDLASMVQRGFIGVDKKFTDIEKNMATRDEMQKGFREVNEKFEQVDQRLIKI